MSLLLEKKQIDKKRLFYINGPAQALNAMSILHEEGVTSETHDIALIGGTGVDIEHNKEIIKVILSIIKTHRWAVIKDISSYEDNLKQLYSNYYFRDCEEEIFKIVGTDAVNEIYMYASKGSVTTMIARAYERFSKIIIFGDTFGIVDSSLGHHYSKIDEIRVFLPVECNKGFLKHIPLHIMPKETLLHVIDNYLLSDKKLEEALAVLERQVDENSVLITTVQYAEWDMMDLAHEVEMYVKAIVKNVSSKSKIFIKEHPRAQFKKRISMLMRRLKEKGYQCEHINDAVLRFAPVECICRRVKFKLLISTASTSGLSVKYLLRYPVDFGVDDDDIKNFRRGDYFKIFVTGMKMALHNLESWDMKSVLYSFDISPWNYLESYKRGATYSNSNSVPANTIFEQINKIYYEKGNRLSDSIKKHSMKSVAVYGMGHIGRKIAVDFVFDNGLDVYLLDSFKAGESYYTKVILSPEEFNESVDCLLITVLDETMIEDIKRTIEAKDITASKIITIYDLVK
ncbi:MAG: alpha-2,8-polysialyltransferase family protein [Clostridiales bacterium]|jgi:hypothetical protein|nr:alpha-2,8-polysialyltransferase family protein [Clostridiales bacterium]